MGKIIEMLTTENYADQSQSKKATSQKKNINLHTYYLVFVYNTLVNRKRENKYWKFLQRGEAELRNTCGASKKPIALLSNELKKQKSKICWKKNLKIKATKNSYLYQKKFINSP